jgi:hypothetical protein
MNLGPVGRAARVGVPDVVLEPAGVLSLRYRRDEHHRRTAVVDQDSTPEVVVVGVDGSEAGERAARFAGRHAREGGADAWSWPTSVPWSQYAVQTSRTTSVVRSPRSVESREAHATIVDPLVED